MTWTEMKAAFNHAKATIYAAHSFLSDMADMLAGNLRTANVRAQTLTKLKRELRDWNIHTNTWRTPR